MSNEKTCIFLTSRENHLQMIYNFIAEKNIKQEFINDIINKKAIKENEIDLCLFTEEKGRIKDICRLQGVKDIKAISIILPEINEKKKRTIVIKAAEYALNSLGMEEVFLKVSSDDKQTKEYLEKLGIESLGEEENNIIFLIEKDYKNEDKKTIDKR